MFSLCVDCLLVLRGAAQQLCLSLGNGSADVHKVCQEHIEDDLIPLSFVLFFAFLSFFLISLVKTTLCSREMSHEHRLESSMFCYLINVLTDLPADAP